MKILSFSIILLFCLYVVGCGLGKYISLGHNFTPSESMSPTINPGDHFSSFGIKDNEIDPIERFDIVVFDPPISEKLRIDGKTKFVFRIIGLGEEKVEIKEGRVFIDDKSLDESSFKKHPSSDNFKKKLFPKMSIFLWEIIVRTVWIVVILGQLHKEISTVKLKL
jgi:signal peptidase I